MTIGVRNSAYGFSAYDYVRPLIADDNQHALVRFNTLLYIQKTLKKPYPK
jgi:hypothetical protein